MRHIVPLFCKECKQEIFSPRGMALILVDSVVLSAFAVLLVSNRELSLLDNAQAVYMMSGVVAALAALLAVMRGSDGFAGERERQTLETLLIAPVRAAEVLAAKMTSILLLWLIIFSLAAPYLWVVGGTGRITAVAMGYLFLVGTLLVVFFGAMMLALSARAKSLKGVLSGGLSIFLLLGSPIVLGPSLRQTAIGRFMDLANPFANALNVLDSAVIDNQGLSFRALSLVIMLCYALGAAWWARMSSRMVSL
jgi:ABC-type Na+ efflux pump permease subunit